MDFDAMKVIWDSQNERPMYALNEVALHAMVRRSNEEFERRVSRCYVREIVAGLFFGGLMFLAAYLVAVNGLAWLVHPKLTNNASSPAEDVMALIAAGAIWTYYSAFMFFMRRRGQRRADAFGSSLRGDLERAIDQTNAEIVMARNILWWGLIPIWTAAGLWVVTLFHMDGAPGWVYPFMAATMVAALAAVVWGKYRSIDNRLQPRVRNLQSLHAKLDDAGK